MSKLYQRKYILDVGNLEITDLDVQFKIDKSLHNDPNNCEIKVFGLHETRRRSLNGAKNLAIKFQAGYEDNLCLLYLGEVRNVLTSREGEDWITTLTSAEFERQRAKCRMKQKSFGKGTPMIRLFEAIAKELNVSLGVNAAKIMKSIRVGAGETFLHGAVLHGRAIDQLDRLCSSMGLSCSIQDGVLQLLDIGGALNEQAVVLTSDTGLIGSPVVDADGDIKCQALIMPGLVCGRKIQVESSLVEKGQWIIWKINYIGESWGKDWYAQIFGKSLTGAGQ